MAAEDAGFCRSDEIMPGQRVALEIGSSKLKRASAVVQYDTVRAASDDKEDSSDGEEFRPERRKQSSTVDEAEEKRRNRLETMGRSKMWQTVGSSDDEEGDTVPRRVAGKRAASDSGDSLSGSGASDSDSGSSEARSRKKHKKKHSKSKHKRHKKHKKHSKSKKAKHRKRSHRDKPSASRTAVNQNEYGAHGVIRADNFSEMQEEFDVWVREVKKMDNFNGTRRETLELFKEFCEDFNTCTLPHPKFYNISKWEHHEALRKARKAAKRRANSERELFDDEQERKAELSRERERSKILEAHEQMIAMSGDKMKSMREQELLKSKMKFLFNTGDVKGARRIQEMLQEDDPFAVQHAKYADLHASAAEVNAAASKAKAPVFNLTL